MTNDNSWREVYRTNADGTAGGSLTDLRRAINEGRPLRVGGREVSYTFPRDGGLWAVCAWESNTRGGSDPTPNNLWVSTWMFHTDGRRLSRGYRLSDGRVVYRRNLRGGAGWFAGGYCACESAPTWELAYDTRKPSGAKIKDFREAVDAGAPVRFVVSALSSGRQHTYAAGPVWSYRVDASPGWLITAASEAHVSADYDAAKGHLEFPDPAQRLSIMVDTNGRYETFIWREPTGATYRHGRNGKRAVRFYVQR